MSPAIELFPWDKFLKEHDQLSEWMAPCFAMKYMKVVKSTLPVWSRNGCPFLSGRRLRTKRFHVHGRRFVNCYLRSDLDQILQAKQLLPTPANSNGNGEWMTKQEAEKVTGWSERYLRRVLKNGSRHLPNRSIATRKERGVSRDGKTNPITLVSRKDILELVQTRDACQFPEGFIPIRKAAKMLGMKLGTLENWTSSGCPHLDGRKMRTKVGPIKNSTGHYRPGVFLSVDEIEEIKVKVQHGPGEPFTDDQGKWLTVGLALKKYRNASRGLLYLHKNKACPQLNGQILHAKQVSRTIPNTYRRSRGWVFLESDLRGLAPPHAGMRPRKITPHPDHIAVVNGSAVKPTVVGDIKPMDPSNLAKATKHRRRGREKGWRDLTARDRDVRMVQEWKDGKFTSPSELAIAFRIDRSYAYKVLRNAGIRLN
jgi:hypothetical protein